MGDLYLPYLCAERGEDFDRLVDPFLDLPIEVLEVEARRDANRCSLRAAFEVSRKVLRRQIYRIQILGIVAGERVQHQGVVFHGSGYGTDVIEAPGEGKDARLAHASEGRFHAHDTAEGR